MKIRLRRGTSAQWATANPVLLNGEPGWDSTLGILKVGDGVTSWSGLPVSNTTGGAPTPQAAGHVAWTMDPAVAPASSSVPTLGTLIMTAFWLDHARTITTLSWVNIAAAVGATAGQNFLCVIGPGGVVFGVTGVDVEAATAGLIVKNLSTPIANAAPGQYWATFLWNAATSGPAVSRAGNANQGLTNVNAAASALRYCTNGAALTAVPGGPINLAANSQSNAQAYTVVVD